MFEVQLYKNNARALLSRILSILNLDWLQHARSVRGVYEFMIVVNLHFISSQTGTRCRLHICFFFFLSFFQFAESRKNPSRRPLTCTQVQTLLRILRKRNCFMRGICCMESSTACYTNPREGWTLFWYKMVEIKSMTPLNVVLKYFKVQRMVARYFVKPQIYVSKYLMQTTEEGSCFTDCIKDWNLIRFLRVWWIDCKITHAT